MAAGGDESPNTVLDRIQQSRERSSPFLQQLQSQNQKMSALSLTVATDQTDAAAPGHEEPSSPTDLPDGGVDSSRARLRLVPSSSNTVESEDARLEKELIDQIRAEAEEVSFEETEREAEREAEEAVRKAQAATETGSSGASGRGAGKSPPRLRGPSLSPLEQAAKMSQSEDGESDPGSPKSPSAIPRHQRLYEYEQQPPPSSPTVSGSSSSSASPKALALPKLQGKGVQNGGQTKAKTTTSIPTPRSATRRQMKQQPQARTQPQPASSAAHPRQQSQPHGKPKSKPAASTPSPSSNRLKRAATAVVASQRFASGAAPKSPRGRANGGAGRGSGDSSAAGAQMSEEGE